MALTIDQIKQVSIPSNLWRNNNLALSNVSPYNRAINLYYAVLAILDEQGTAGDTNLGASQATSTTTITSSTGTDVVILGANNTRSGVMTATQADNLTNLVTLSGVAANSAHLGTFTGTTIADSSTIKAALQSLETALEAVASESSQDAVGSILTDSSTIDFTYDDATPSITAGVKSNSISNTNLTSGTGGIYKGSGTIASGAAATVTSSSTFRINYSSTDPGITVDDVDESTTIYSGSGSNYVYANNDNVEIVAGKGLIIPKISGAARDAIASPTAGAFIYNTTTNKLNFYNGSTWEVVTSS